MRVTLAQFVRKSTDRYCGEKINCFFFCQLRRNFRFNLVFATSQVIVACLNSVFFYLQKCAEKFIANRILDIIYIIIILLSCWPLNLLQIWINSKPTQTIEDNYFFGSLKLWGFFYIIAIPLNIKFLRKCYTSS